MSECFAVARTRRIRCTAHSLYYKCKSGSNPVSLFKLSFVELLIIARLAQTHSLALVARGSTQ
jgi:hypothetical protein